MADSWFLTAVISHFYSAVYVAMGRHSRRQDCWRCYELTQESESAFVEYFDRAFQNNPRLHRERGGRSRPPVHSKDNPGFACLLVILRQDTYHSMESGMRSVRTPWDGEPIPDHTALVRYL